MFRFKLVHLVNLAAVMLMFAVAALMFAAFDVDHAPVSRKAATSADSSVTRAETARSLIARMESENNAAKAKTIAALGSMKDPRAVPALVSALKNKDTNIQKSAVVALVQMKAPEAIPQFIVMLKNGNTDVREEIERGLGSIDGAKAIKLLIRALGDRDPEVVRTVTNSLVKIGAPAVRPLIGKLDKLKKAGVDTLIAIGPQAIDPLIATFMVSNSNLRQNLVDILSVIGTPAVPSLLVALKSKNERIRAGAATVLGSIDDPRLTQPLIAALEDKDRGVLRQVARALAVKKDPQSFEPLVALLTHENSDVRSSAAYALGPLADPRLFDPMIALLKDKSRNVREYAARALGILKDPRAVAPLFVLMQDSYKGVTDAALSALTNMGTAAAPVALDMLEKRDRRNRTGAIRFLIAFSPVAVEPLVASVKYIYIRENGLVDVETSRVIEAIGKAGDAAVDPLLIALKDDDPQTRINAAIVSGKIGNDRLAKPLMEATRDEDKEVRRIAIVALSQIKGDEVLSFLIHALSHDDYVLRRQAVKSLATRGDPKAVEPLIAYMERNAVFADSKPTQTETGVISDVVTVLGDLGDRRAIAPLIKSFTYHMTHFAAVKALAGFGSAAVEPLIAALRHDNKKVREEAAETLGKIQDIRAQAPLIASLKDSDPKVRWYAARALGGSKGPKVVTALITSLKDESSRVRWEAIRSLKTRDDPRTIDPLIILLQDKSDEVRYEAGDVLAEIKSPRALKPLIAALKDKSFKVRAVAARGLGLLGDSSAVPHLHENLTDWLSAKTVAISLLKLGWQPQTSEDEIRLLIAQENGKKLRSDAVWPDAKKILLGDLASGHSTRLHDYAMQSLVAIGKKEVFPLLIKKLWEPKSMPGILSLFLNSRHAPLKAEAGKWAKRHGYRIHTFYRPSTPGQRKSGWNR